MTYLNGPGKSAFTVFIRIFLRWPLNTELNIFTNKIKHEHKTASDMINSKSPTAHSGQSTGSNKKSPLKKIFN